jgi:hypothetical protein
MVDANVAPVGSRYQDQRHFIVSETLDELHGPTSGVVVLDKHLDWSADPSYDLEDPGDASLMYQIVLREASSAQDLRRFLDAATLKRLWPTLRLFDRLRALWETNHPELISIPRQAGR